MEEEVLADGDDTTPLMGSDRQASDYYNLSSLIPVTGFADYVHGRQVLTANWYKDDFAVSGSLADITKTHPCNKQIFL